jgi:hypothetical protein
VRLRTVAVVAVGVLVVGGGGTLATLSSSGILDGAQNLLGSQLLQSPCLPELGGGLSAAAAGGIKNLDRVQLRNVVDIAETAAAVAKENGLDGEQLLQAMTVAYAAALVESDLRNLPSRAVPASLAFDYDAYAGGRIPPGDHTSVGLFQQLDAWGPVSVRMNRKGSARMFLTGGRAGQPGLLDIAGWDRLDAGVLAQRVQVSAYPLRYGQRVPQARAIAAVVLGTRSAGHGGSVQAGGAADAAAGASGGVSGLSAGVFRTGTACQPASQRSGKIGKCPAVGSGSARGLTPDAVAVLRCGLGDFPMVRAYGCLASSGHTPGSDHYTGRACDFMIPGQARRDTSDGLALGNSMAAYFVDNAETFGVTYVIWHGRIWNSARAAEGWRPYRHPSGSGNWTLMHMDHVHVSVKGQAGMYGWGA